MSCFIMNGNSISQIANYMERLANMNFSVNGLSVPDSLRAEIGNGFVEAQDIYYKLYDLNCAAYAGRYNETPADIPEYFRYDISKITEWGEGHFIIEAWHYQILKTLQCLIYQCDEDATAKSNLLQGLKDLERALTSFIVCNNDYYNKAVWG